MNHPLYKSAEAYQRAMTAYDMAVTQAPVPYESRYVDTRHGRTHILSGGNPDKPPLLLLHGWNGSAAGMGGEFPFVFDHFRVYMPDIVGHGGKSDPHRPNPKGSTFADWALDVLDGLALNKVIVMGVSGGGWLTIKLAAFASDRLYAAVPINPAGTTRFFHPKFLWAARGLAYGTLEGGYIFARGISAGKKDDPVIDGFAEGVVAGMGQFKTQGAPPFIPNQELQNISCPILFVLGDQDIFFPKQAAARVKKQISQAQIQIIKGAGHLLLTDQVAEAAVAIIHFLQTQTEVDL